MAFPKELWELSFVKGTENYSSQHSLGEAMAVDICVFWYGGCDRRTWIQNSTCFGHLTRQVQFLAQRRAEKRGMLLGDCAYILESLHHGQMVYKKQLKYAHSSRPAGNFAY